MIEIVTTRSKRFGKELSFPDVGVKSISAEGVVELPEDIAKLMVENGSGWDYKGDFNTEIQKTEDGGEQLIGSEEEEIIVPKESEPINAPEEEEKEEDSNEEENTEVDLNDLSVVKLRAICKEAGFQSKDYIKLKKDKLIEFIQEKAQ